MTIVVKRGAPLSLRETQILELIVRGWTNEKIAASFNPPAALNTVKAHTRRILAKLGAANRTEAVALYVRQKAAAGQTTVDYKSVVVVCRTDGQSDEFPHDHTMDIDMGGTLVIHDRNLTVVAAYSHEHWCRARLEPPQDPDAKEGEENA